MSAGWEAGFDTAARDHRVALVGPLKGGGPWQRKERTGFAREEFRIDFDHRQVTRPNGNTSGNWAEPPAMAPYTVVTFDARHCTPCPQRALCTRSNDPRKGRTINFLPRHLHEIQARNRADQQNLQWKRLYASRSGVEGTVNELANGHRARRCRYHGRAKTHVQHVLTAIAINIERLSEQEPEGSAYRPRRPTAFQQYLDARGLPRPLWWRQGK